jgi:hypothetical protein
MNIRSTIMKPVLPLLVFAILAACEVPDNPSQSSGAGVEILIEPGRNCWRNMCFTYDAVRNAVSVPGRNPVRIPAAIDLRKGSLTQAEFTTIYRTATMAYANGVGRR